MIAVVRAGVRGPGVRRRKAQVMAAGQAAGGQRGIFGWNAERAAQALRLTWGEFYQDTGTEDGRRRARRPDGDGRVLTGDTADELAAGFPATAPAITPLTRGFTSLTCPRRGAAVPLISPGSGGPASPTR